MFNYFNYINLIRHIAAVFVIYVHSFELIKNDNIDYIKYLFSIDMGSIAVNIFFLLSGVLIYNSALNSVNIKDYIKKRFLRIYPALVVCILLTVFVFSIISTIDFWSYISNNITLNYISNLLFLGNYSVYEIFETNYYPSVANGSLWTLRYEVVMYAITLIFVHPYFRKHSYFIYIIFIFFLISYIVNVDEAKSMFTNMARLGSYFFMGALFSRINFLLYKNYIIIGSIIVFIGILLFDKYDDILILFLISIVLKYSLDYVYYTSKNKSKFNFDISYGLYIYAFPVQQILAKYICFSNVYMYFLCSLFVTVLFALFSWFLIEKKALKLKYEK